MSQLNRIGSAPEVSRFLRGTVCLLDIHLVEMVERPSTNRPTAASATLTRVAALGACAASGSFERARLICCGRVQGGHVLLAGRVGELQR